MGLVKALAVETKKGRERIEEEVARRKVHMRMSNGSILEQELFEKLCNLTYLREGFETVKTNKGAPGIDKQTIDDFERELSANLKRLREDLEGWTYQPLPVRHVEIPKPGGGTRPLGIPCIRDRVVQATMKMLLEPILDPLFSEHSYGFRPGKGQQQAVAAAKRIVTSGKEYIVDIDLAKFFTTINHDRLMSRLADVIEDKRILRLIGITLRSGVMKNGLVSTTTEGAPQGSPLSPLLSNFVLDELDRELEKRNLEFCRFADDCNIFVKTQKAADRVMQNVSEFIEKKLKLVVNKEKSKVSLSQRVKFLGITIIAGAIAISAQSMARAMDKVESLTPRGTHLTLEETIKRINSWYTGWSAYYKMTEYPSQLAMIEAHTRRRLRARFIRQQKSRRNLFNKLVSRGVPRKQAASAAFSNMSCWGLSHTRAVEKAYSNKWFIGMMGLKTRSSEKHHHWRHLKEWIKLT